MTLSTTEAPPISFQAVSPRTGHPAGAVFAETSEAEVAGAVAAAAGAFASYSCLPGEVRARLLDRIADELEAKRTELVRLADDETALGPVRLESEVDRTTGQLRLFAAAVRSGELLDVVIDTADPRRTPPRPDLRRTTIPIGPIAVLGASNFPLAFGVAGTDTASALAAGCTVIVKGHPSHPGTSALCSDAVAAAIDAVSAPEGTYSEVRGWGRQVGLALVTAPAVRAAAFTGSYAGARALHDAAAARPDPIPVYAEAGSLNPVFVTQAAMRERAAQIAEGLLGSVTSGNGQLCTKPGVVLVVGDGAAGDFADRVAAVAATREPAPLLNDALRTLLVDRVTRTTSVGDVTCHAGGDAGKWSTGFPLTVLSTRLRTFLDEPALREEHFGPVVLIVECDSDADFLSVGTDLDGSLTATVHGGEAETEALAPLVQALAHRAGRIVWNGFPTGVAVTAAMHHGGPHPATLSSAHTSVGTAAARRFLRPVVFQDTPDALLPEALQKANPLGLWRIVDGVPSRDPFSDR